ncbi:MAG TPA: hypothetical protein VE544_11845, partial [Nitrososphaeraceae archaeon]|nr:hypothetical protein [Nitrososphaeraceae archaeon]
MSPVITTGLIVIVIAIILLASNFTIINAQQQVQSDGGLTATLNGSSFTRGDTITISGTVVERAIDSFVAIEVIGPNSEIVENGFPAVTADNRFTYSFVAGEDTQLDTTPMEETGNYRVIVRYQQPGEDITSEDYFAEVEFIFGYASTATAPQPQTGPIINSQPATIQRPTLFQSVNDSFSIQVPDGWIIHDLDNTGSAMFEEATQGYGILAQLCPE